MKLLFLAIIEVLLAFPLAQDFGYDSYGRMGSVSSGGCSATYAYLPNSDLLQSTTFRNGGNPVLTATRTWDYGTRLASVLNSVDGAPVTSDGYLYDSLQRRTQSNLEDGSFWKYEYDDRGEVTKARHYWSDGTLVEGQHFGYDYDAIGNRTAAYLGGDKRDSNLRTQSYTINSLNQYTTIGDTGYRDILGSALATNNVTVNGTNASRKLEYFRQEIGVANSSGPIWQSVTISSGGSNYTAGLAVPGLSQNLSYDEDGNLIFDGIWNYSWDGENRLASMSMTNLPGAPNRLRLDFTYDYLGRRVQKVVSFANGGGYTGVYTNRYLYDGWNLVATFKGRSATQNAIQDSYLWGQDLSGTMTGAGGIGGLLMVTTTNGQSFVCHDGNGNVRALVSAADKTIVARYEYGPFGQPLRTTGPQAKANPFRFSSKFTDEESGLVYYGYRYYSPSQGRWLGRDTKSEMAEMEAVNLFQYCRNNPFSNFDPDGRSWEQFFQLVTATAAGAAAGAGTGYLTSGFNPAGAAVGAMSGAINGFVSGLTGIIYGQSWGTILKNSLVNGGLSGIPGGMGQFGIGWGAVGGAIGSMGNAAFSGTNTKEGYLFAAAMGAVFGGGGGYAGEAEDKILDAVLCAASESGSNSALGLWNFFEQ